MLNDKNLDSLDYQILQLIANNSRISFLEVARMCNVSGAAIHQRVQKMTNNNIIKGSEFSLDMAQIGYNTCAYLTLHFNYSCEMETIIRKIENIDNIAECHYMADPYKILIKIYASNNHELHEIIERQIKPLGITEIDVTISCGELFKRQITPR